MNEAVNTIHRNIERIANTEDPRELHSLGESVHYQSQGEGALYYEDFTRSLDLNDLERSNHLHELAKVGKDVKHAALDAMPEEDLEDLHNNIRTFEISSDGEVEPPKPIVGESEVLGDEASPSIPNGEDPIEAEKTNITESETK